MNDLTLTMPRLGETMEEGVIVTWMVAPGQSFRRGEPILELETDKTVVEFPALGDGVIDEVLVGPGGRIPVGEPIARARVSNGADWASEAAEPASEGAPEAAPVSAALLRMPRLGETMEEGVIVQWLVAEGSAYARGAPILEIETDKTVAEVPALSEGRLLRILAQPGARLAVGTPIAEVAGEVEAFAPPDVAPTPALTPAPVTAQAAAVEAPVPPAATAPGAKLRATPLARRIARQRGLSLAAITGSGRRGRIERADVEAAPLEARDGPAPSDLAFLDLPDGRLAYAVAGTGGTVHLLIHGFAGDRSAWAQMTAAIARAGHTAVVPDLPGHGATSLEAEAPEAAVAALSALAQRLGPGLTLVGHSLGAAIAVRLAEALGPQVARLVLVTPAGCGPRIGADFVHGMAQASTPGEVAHLLRLLGPRAGALSEAALVAMAREAGRGRLRALAQALATPDGRQRIDILRPLATLAERLPVSALFGTEDRVVAPGDAMNLPPRVAVHFLPAGHMPQWDAPREVSALVLGGLHHG